MENKAHFDLNKALQDWKAELTTQPGVSAENARELETHLLESINAFRKIGCTDQDAFSRAQRRVGSVQELGAEFAKENLLKVWRDRVFWITVFPFILTLIYLVTHQLFEKLAHTVNAALGLSQSIVLALLDATPPLLVAIAMATGFAEVIFRRLHWIFARRRWIATTGVIAILGTAFVAAGSPETRENLPYQVICEIGFLAFAVFIRPRELAIVLPTTSTARRRSSIALWRDRLFWAVLGCLAIRAWLLGSQILGVEVVRIKGRAVLVNPWMFATYWTALFLPMAIVGLLLASARLSSLTQWLCTRLRAGFVACALALVWVGGALWIWRGFPLPDVTNLSAADWNILMQRDFLSGIIFAGGLITITLWTMPSHADQLQEAKVRFRST